MRGVGTNIFYMPDSDPLIRHFEDILADPAARPATKVAAGKELAKLRERQPVLVDPLGRMRAVVEKYAPEVEGMEDAPPDPMRDLDFQAMVGRAANPVLWEWCAYCPAEPVRAERGVVSAVRRLRLGKGPYGPPDSDELTQRRRKRRAS
jgi:hypothetical protein